MRVVVQNDFAGGVEFAQGPHRVRFVMRAAGTGGIHWRGEIRDMPAAHGSHGDMPPADAVPVAVRIVVSAAPTVEGAIAALDGWLKRHGALLSPSDLALCAESGWSTDAPAGAPVPVSVPELARQAGRGNLSQALWGFARRWAPSPSAPRRN